MVRGKARKHGISFPVSDFTHRLPCRYTNVTLYEELFMIPLHRRHLKTAVQKEREFSPHYLFNQLPCRFQVFERVNESHHYNTRHSVNDFILPKLGSYGIKSFHYIGAEIWNSLPNEIQTTFSKSVFKVRCKKTFYVSPL